MKFNKNFYIAFLIILSAIVNCPLIFAAGDDKFFAPETNKIHKMVAEKASAAARNFVDEFNKKSGSEILLGEIFYDQKFHRLYIEIEGRVVVSESLHKMFIKGEKIYSADGNFAFDMAFKNPVKTTENITYELAGEIIIFQENILNGIARVTPVVNAAYNPVGETVLKFLEEARIRKLATIAAETLTSFSPEKLDILKDELQKRADAMGDTNLQKILFLTGKAGHFTRFFVYALLKSIPEMIGGSVGGSIGSVVGSLLLPGAGTIVGAYIGSVISGQIVYASQYRIPINLKLARLKTLGRLCKSGEMNNAAGKRFNSVRKDFNKDIRQDLDKHSYIVVDEVLKSLKEMKKENEQLKAILSKDMYDILQYQLVHENDRYASRKLKQLENL